MSSHNAEQPSMTLSAAATAAARTRARLEVHGLRGSAGAALLAEVVPLCAEPLLVIAADLKTARQMVDDLTFFAGTDSTVCLFPHWEVRPYDPLTPHPEVEATRLATLTALLDGQVRVVVTTIRALLQRVIPRTVLAELREKLLVEEEYPRNELLPRLLALGYQPVPLVEDRGTFAVRGDILDIFPPTGAHPVRIEFFGDYIERMRPFDALTQRSAAQDLPVLELLPAREMILSGEHLATFSRRLKERCDTLGLPRPQREAILEEVREGLLAPGRSFLLPLNYEQLDTLLDYLPQRRWVWLDPTDAEQEADRLSDEARAGEARLRAAAEPHVAFSELYLDDQDLAVWRRTEPQIEFTALRVYQLGEEQDAITLKVLTNSELHVDLRHSDVGLQPLIDCLRQWRTAHWRVLLVCHRRGQAERLRDLLAPHGFALPAATEGFPATLPPGSIALTLGNLDAGFQLPTERLAVITEEEIFGHRAKRRGLTAARTDALLSSLAELKEGDFVVHTDHGIGHYRGLLHIETGVTAGDFLHLEYAGEDKLYVPVERIEKVQKYVGGEGPRLDKLGGNSWEKAQVKARAAVEELARELLQLYARRKLSQGFGFSPPDRHFREFEAAFPYEETPDQQAAIDETLADMVADRAMDRLICGDVGYGKTEVAMRAAHKAALDGKQVAVLVPTTILARQHWASFSERFAETPVVVDMVSRFRTPTEQKSTLERTAAGQVDILIGTHRLLQRDVKFRDLGLVVIDEEQRFGVAHKERLKKMRAAVDFLTLTATPIPRTLNMSMMGLRDISVIDTAPVDRLAIRTYVTRFDNELVRDAILRELRRGGQVFFVHNRVQSINAMADLLRQLIPEAKIAVGHGQLGEKALETVMLDFIEGRTNVLVSTTIIENGLDIARANTIIVNRADCFGLAQLYQLRGRVGRSQQRAYAYLLIPGEGGLTRDARERLRVLQELTELGAGFRIANHDLELRGAGDLLGGKQAGQIAAIGYELYADLLDETIRELQGQSHEERIDPELRLGLSAYFPEKYMLDPNQRLVFYKKLAAANDDGVIYALADELRDRYGELPPPAELLLESMKLRVMLKRCKIETAEYDGRRLVFGFHPTTPVGPEKILALLNDPEKKYAFSPDYRLTITIGKLAPEEVLERAKKELQTLG
ncbi:MAG: transcription-repair coupling factor [Desulfuromonadales bacterium]|nr:transcription-repair coupling factor [Desulfuromonadales bacterium]